MARGRQSERQRPRKPPAGMQAAIAVLDAQEASTSKDELDNLWQANVECESIDPDQLDRSECCLVGNHFALCKETQQEKLRRLDDLAVWMARNPERFFPEGEVDVHRQRRNMYRAYRLWRLMADIATLNTQEYEAFRCACEQLFMTLHPVTQQTQKEMDQFYHDHFLRIFEAFERLWGVAADACDFEAYPDGFYSFFQKLDPKLCHALGLDEQQFASDHEQNHEDSLSPDDHHDTPGATGH